MATKRKRRTRGRIVEVTRGVIGYLLTGELPARDGGDFFEVLQKTGPGNAASLRADWSEVRDRLLSDWIAAHPGTRPWAWWRFGAPKWRPEDMPARVQPLGVLDCAEPRRRVGGVGTPSYEVLNVWPHFDRGIPTSWVSRFDEEYYSGRRRDVHGNPIGAEFARSGFTGMAPDPNDPPTFESEAGYLARHGLLTAAERRRLSADAFKPERLSFDDGEADLVSRGAMGGVH